MVLGNIDGIINGIKLAAELTDSISTKSYGKIEYYGLGIICILM